MFIIIIIIIKKKQYFSNVCICLVFLRSHSFLLFFLVFGTDFWDATVGPWKLKCLEPTRTPEGMLRVEVFLL